MPVDAGSVRVEASASGRQKFVANVEIRDGESYVVEVPELPRASADSAAGQSPADTTRDSGSNHAAAYVVGGLGLAAIGVGSYFGVRAIQDHKTAEKGCSDECEDKPSHQAEQNAVFHGWLSTIGIGAGLAAVGVAIYLYADAEAEVSEASQVALVPSAGAGGAQLDLIWVY
jgi:predicted Fe-Mo cluster-binding NifX family protein